MIQLKMLTPSYLQKTIWIAVGVGGWFMIEIKPGELNVELEGRFLTTARSWRKMFWSREFHLNPVAVFFQNQASVVLSRRYIQLQME